MFESEKIIKKKMTKTILSVNAGTSSVKATFYTLDSPPREIVDVSVTGLSSPPPSIKYKCRGQKYKEQLDVNIDTPPKAFNLLLDRCIHDPRLLELTSTDDLEYICHRVVHGGDYDQPIIITDKTYDYLKTLDHLAPLYDLSPSCSLFPRHWFSRGLKRNESVTLGLCHSL